MRYVRKEVKTKYSDLIIDDAVAKSLAYISDEVKNDEEYSDEELDYLLEDLSYSAGEYIEKSFKIYNEGDPNENLYSKDGVLGTCQQYMQMNHREEAKDILLGYNDLEMCTSEDSQKSEMYANIMYLSNVMAHILAENRTNLESIKNLKEEGIDINDAIKDMYALKDRCIREIIKCKENGENLEIFFTYDEGVNQTFTAIIPNYMEPFSMHINKNTGIDEDTFEKYPPKSIEMLPNYKTIYPFKVTPEKENALKYIYRNIEDRDLKRVKSRVKWYFDAQERLREPKTKISFQKEGEIKDEKASIIREIIEIEELIDEQMAQRVQLKDERKKLNNEKKELQISINEQEKNKNLVGPEL